MKHLMLYALQLNQRRTSAFYLLRQDSNDTKLPLRDQLRLEGITPAEDRPRTLREMFIDAEYENDDDDL